MDETTSPAAVLEHVLTDIRDTHERQAELTRFYLGGVLNRRDAIAWIVRATSRPDVHDDERRAIRSLQRRYSIGDAVIEDARRRASGSLASDVHPEQV
jgi:hypothetical protein